MIKKEDGQYCVYSHDGSRKFGCYSSEGEAQHRLKQIEYFKHTKSGDKSMSVKDETVKANMKKAIMMVAAKAKLDPNAKVRNRGNVVFPANSKKVKDKKDHFPINNENQARNALSRVAQYSSVPPWYEGSLDELQKAVQNAVKNKYPGIQVTKGEVSVKNPNNTDPKVPQVETPSLEGASEVEKVYATIASLAPEKHKTFASALVKNLQNQQDRLKEAVLLAEKLLDEGITPEEFGVLMDWTQQDILIQLLNA